MKKVLIVVISLIVITLIGIGIYFKMSYTLTLTRSDDTVKTERIFASSDSIAFAKSLDNLLLSFRTSSLVYKELGNTTWVNKIELVDFMGGDLFKKLDKLTIMRCAENRKRYNENLLGELPEDVSYIYGLIVLNGLNN